MKTVEDFHREETVKVEDMNQTIIDTTVNPVTFFQIGNTYQYYNYKFTLWARGKWKSELHKEKGARTVYEVTFNGNTAEKYYMDSSGIKKRIGDDRSNRDKGGSVNDEKKATGTKRVPKTANETAAQIRTKYADTIKAVRDKVSKLQDDERIASALNLLCTMIETAASERIENITNAARNAHLANVARREQATAELNQKQAEMQTALSNCDFAKVAVLGNTAKALQAELILLEQSIAAYETAQSESEASEASEATEETTAEETAE